MYRIRKYVKGDYMEEIGKCHCSSKKHIMGLCAAITGVCIVFIGHVCMLKKCQE